QLNRREPWPAPTALVARVNMGRWLGDCTCGQDAPLIDPEWSLAVCFTCSQVYRTIVMPDQWQAIDAALMRRPFAINRNWTPGETLEELLQENADHDIEK
ncbi:MAG TPA: hypothetical protein VNO55_04610, partial [Polyangia bacterium]|nr:hypothetical protein [Polyangia bacterium]